MAISHEFNPLAQYVVRKEFLMGGIDYKPGDLVAATTSVGRLRNLYEEGYIWYGWQQARHIEAERVATEKTAAIIKAKEDAALEAKKPKKKVKKPKKKVK